MTRTYVVSVYVQFLSYYYAFLYEVASDDDQRFANFARRALRRTNSNGMRFHPPNSVELAVSTNTLRRQKTQKQTDRRKQDKYK